jgi:hypothetical protein
MVVILQVKKYEISYTINPFLVIIYLLSQKYLKFFFVQNLTFTFIYVKILLNKLLLLYNQ